MTRASVPGPTSTTRQLLLAVALLSLAVPAAARADDAALGVRAAAMARDGRCQDALALLDSAGRSDAGLALLRGKCQLELRRYPDAVASLEEAKRLDPSRTDVDLPLAMARFHQGDLDGARTALDAAAPHAGDRAEYHLYRGLLLLQAAESESAAASLERARDLNPLAVEPSASYYAGLAWASAEDQARAESALRQVIDSAPGTVWATEAERALVRIEGGERAWWAWVQGGFEYDDNVVLRGRSVVLPQEISGQHDVRGVWTVHGGYEFLRTPDWSAGAAITYYGSAHFDLDQFDQHYPVLSLWLDRRLAEATTLRLRYDTGYAWVDNDPFLFTHGLTGTVFHDWGREGSSRLFAGYYRSNYLYGQEADVPDGPGGPLRTCLDRDDIICGPAGLDESRERNRDGDGWLAGVEHTYRVGALDTELIAGYLFDYFSARGREYSYTAHQIRAESRTALPWDLELRTLVSYTYAPYRNASTYPDPARLFLNRQYFLSDDPRSDDIWYFRVELEKYWTEQLSTSVRYGYLNNHSNVAVFDYDREITGIYVTYRFRQ